MCKVMFSSNVEEINLPLSTKLASLGSRWPFQKIVEKEENKNKKFMISAFAY